MDEPVVQSINQHTQKTTLDWLFNILVQPSTGAGRGVAPAVHEQYGLSLDLLRQALVEVGNVVNVLTTEVPGKVLDARQGKALADSIQAILDQKAAANGIATLGADGKIPSAQIPSLAIVDVFPVASEAAMLASGAEQGDMAIRSDTSQVFILSASPATTIENWIELSALKALVDAAVAEVKGSGYTSGTLKSHEDAITTLNANDTTEGSVAKTVKDAVTPIETRLDSTELTLARQGQDLASVKQTLQQGNGATLDFSGIGSVTLDARATGRANPTIDGLTVTNLVIDGSGNSTTGWSAINATLSSVSGWLRSLKTGPYHGMVTQLPVSKGELLIAITLRADIEHAFRISIQKDSHSTSTFVSLGGRLATVAGSTYYGIVDTTAWAESTMWLRIQDGENTFTGTYVEAKDVVVVNLTSTFGADNEPSATDCAKIFSYFDGTKSIQLPARIISKSEDESESSTIYIADNEEVRSVPAIADEVKMVNGQLVKVQNVSEPETLPTSGWSHDPTADVNVYRAYKTGWISIRNVKTSSTATALCFNDEKTFRVTSGASFDSEGINFNISNVLYIRINKTSIDAMVGANVTEKINAYLLAHPVTVYYQLATPIITPLLTSGILQAKPNGTVYFEPYYEGSHQTDASSEITLPYEGTIDKLTGYDENLEPYEVPSTVYTLVGTLLTITGAVENEVFYVELSRSEPLAPEMSVNTLNNMVVPTIVNASTYTVLEGDHTLLVNYTATGACTITIPTALILAYKRLVIKDSGGGAATKNIIIGTQGTEKIDGVDTYVINTAKGKVELASDGANMWVVG